MDYISAREAADKWGISQRRVAVLCSENRIKNAAMIGNMWVIPSTAEKPADARSIRYTVNSEKKVKPFLKWAGGKGQLISEIKKYYPFADGKITKYAEPLVGGGAVLFDILNTFDLDEVYISDINTELINTYQIIRDDADKLISMLEVMQSEFVSLNTEDRKIYYLSKRRQFNDLKINGNEGINIQKEWQEYPLVVPKLYKKYMELEKRYEDAPDLLRFTDNVCLSVKSMPVSIKKGKKLEDGRER